MEHALKSSGTSGQRAGQLKVMKSATNDGIYRLTRAFRTKFAEPRLLGVFLFITSFAMHSNIQMGINDIVEMGRDCPTI